MFNVLRSPIAFNYSLPFLKYYQIQNQIQVVKSDFEKQFLCSNNVQTKNDSYNRYLPGGPQNDDLTQSVLEK